MPTERVKPNYRDRDIPAARSNMPVNGANDMSHLPAFIDRRSGAELISSRLFPVSKRTLETWPLAWRRVNGRAICRTTELLEFAQSKLDAASPVRGGPG